jgi:hypothetical protein
MLISGSRARHSVAASRIAAMLRRASARWALGDLSAVGVGYQNVTPRSELADGRADLLAEVAGIFEGTSEGEPDEVLARSAARLCRLAGADEAAIPGWVEVGRRRRANAGKLPLTLGFR